MTSELRFVRNGEVTLALEVRGSGPVALLFVHGWISARRMWYDVAARLDPARYTSLLLDFRGAGASDRPGVGHDLEGYASDLTTALDAAGPATVVAHSMGAKVAQFVATHQPANLLGLVLVAPGTAVGGHAATPRHRALAEAAFGSRARIAPFVAASMKRPIPAETMERLVEDALIAQHEAWFGWYDRGRSVDFADRLARIVVPTVAVAGEHDALAAPARVRRDVVERIPGARFVTVRGAGHNLPVEAPETVAGIVERVASGRPAE